MSLPITEAEWAAVVGNPQLTRSIFGPTDVCSLLVLVGNNIHRVVLHQVPFREFNLVPFVDNVSVRDPSVRIVLQLESTVRGSGLAASFRLRWMSWYTRLVDNRPTYHYTVRPNAIFVQVPINPSVTPHVPRSSPYPQLPLPGGDRVYEVPVVVRDFSRVTANLMNIVRSTRADRSLTRVAKNGFSGSSYKRPVYPVTLTHSAHDVTYDFAGNPPFVGAPYEVEEYYKSITSLRTPNFGRLKKNKLPVNSYSCTIRRTKNSPGYLKTQALLFVGKPTAKNFKGQSTGFFAPIVGPSFRSDLVNKSIKKLEKKADADISANIAQDIAQFGQLKSLIADNATRIARAITQVKRGNITGALHALGSPKGIRGSSRTRDIAQDWLSIQYGWKILLKEIDDLMRILANSINNNPPSRSIRAQSEAEDSSVLTHEFSDQHAKSRSEIRTFYRCKIGLKYSVSNQLLAYTQQLGFTNPVNLAYEVLPYSFVVDWFIPIGPYLESISAWQGMVFKEGYVTQSARQYYNGVASGSKTTFAGAYVNTSAGSLEQEWLVIARSRLTSFPRLNLPIPKNPVSLEHALNALALMRVAFR